MPDIQITDQLDKPVEPVPIDWTHPSSLLNRLKTEALHLAVLPDFLDRKDLILTKAATSPIRFEARAGHQFQLGNTKPEITVAPAAHISISANTTAGSDLFDGDPFHQPATVPAHTGYVGISFEGTIDVGLTSSEADLTFGFDKAATVGLEHRKAFPLGSDEPALGSALARTLAAFVIPAGISDFDRLAINDIASVSGQRALTFSGSVSVSAAPNPLASVHLPLGLPGFSVQAAAIADVSASFTISGSWQLRVRRQDDATIELSFLREHGSALNAGLSASAGVTAALGSTDWLPKVLGAITGHGHTGDANPLADLPPSDAEAFNAALQQGLDHSLKARIEESLSASRDDQAAFQYEIQPAHLSPDAAAAVQAALRGDLRALTEMENNAHPDGTLAPGLKMLNSLLTEVRRRRAAFKLNLIGALNFLSAAEFVRNSEVLTDGVSGEVTIRETVSGERISALLEPARSEALRKAMFDAVLVTTTYRAGRAIALPTLQCEHTHFATRQNTDAKTLSDYLHWFGALNLLSEEDAAATLKAFMPGGPSSCVLHTAFGDRESTALFLDGNTPRPRSWYLELGRRALRAMLDVEHQPNDRLRYRILDDALWSRALDIGANVNLGPLLGLSTADERVTYLVGDLFIITGWADAMTTVAELVHDIRNFVGSAEPAALLENDAFRKKRDTLQRKLSAVVQASKTRFDTPWGMVSLFLAAGSPPTAWGKAVARGLAIERHSSPAIAAAQP